VLKRRSKAIGHKNIIKDEVLVFGQFFTCELGPNYQPITGANPTIVCYNATSSPVHFENENIFFYSAKTL
jgi:hypothetical protein